MQRSRLPSVARQLLGEVPDADLLERYASGRSDDAFAQLLARYSRLVWGQCRNLLANDADADDAFQATFLTLARSVAKLKPGLPLGPWLHGVAFRVCKNAQRAKARRTKRERATAVSEASRPVADSQWESAFAAVAEEVQKLPEAQRAAFVLCCIEGRATTEAAAALGQKLGTFSARLSRAKQTLLDRLAKRGLGAGVLALGGVTGSVAVAPAALIQRTLSLVPSGAAVPSSIHALMQGVTGMTMIRIKLLAAGVMVATGFGLSVGGGWSGEAAAQYVPPGFEKAPSPWDPKSVSNLEKLKADLEKAKAELAKAEADAAVQGRLEQFNRFVTEHQILPTKYEYEPLVGKGLTTQAFEAKLAEREKAGWEFLGQVAFDTSKDRGGAGQLNNGTTPCLVFRKRPEQPAMWRGGMHLNGAGESRDAFVTPQITPAVAPPASKVAKPTDPVAPAPLAPPAFAPVRPTSALPTPTAPGGNVPGSSALPGSGGAPSKPVPLGQDPPVVYPGYPVKETVPKPQSYLDRIAELEKLVEQLRVKGPKLPEPPISVKFTRDEFGAWDTMDLTGILLRLLPGKVNGVDKISVIVDDNVLQVSGTQESIAEVKALLKKLKK